MNENNDAIRLKLAWQTAFVLRTCPDKHTLLVADPDDNLKRHLSICHVCREKRTMPQHEWDASKSLFDKFASKAMKPGIGTDKQEGQVWTIKGEFGGWRKDGRFIRPPSVILLGQVAGTPTWRVAQLHNYDQLVGNGDVTLDERCGYAEAWNCYSLKSDSFDKCLGVVKSEELQQIHAASVTTHDLAPDGSVLSFFRKMEIDIGTFVTAPTEGAMLENSIEEVLELMPGLKLAISGAKDFVLDIAAGTLDLLRGTFRPAMNLRGGTTKPTDIKLSDEQKALVEKHCPVIPINVTVVGDTLTVTLEWLCEKPVMVPQFVVILNGVEFADENSVRIENDKITILHPSFSADNALITSMKFSCFKDILSLEISCAAQ